MEDSPSSLMLVRYANNTKKKDKMHEVQVLEEAYDAQYDEVGLYTVTIQPEPDEIDVDDAIVAHHTEAYMVLKCQLMVSVQDLYVSDWTLKLLET